MKNRKAWGLVAVLASVLVSGGLGLAIAALQARPVKGLRVQLLPPKEWGFKTARAVTFTPQGVIVRFEDRYTCGFVMVRRERSHPGFGR